MVHLTIGIVDEEAGWWIKRRTLTIGIVDEQGDGG